MVRQKILMPIVLAFVLLGTASCSSSDSSGPSGETETETETETTATTSTAEGAVTTEAFPDGLRDVRYCEVLLVNNDEEGFSAEVWNTLGLNDCPQDQWEALVPETIATERDALAALMNGPRYWVLDSISSNAAPQDRPQTMFGELDMFLAASVNLGPTTPSQDPYVERSVARDTVFGFDAGSEIYELTDPEGTVYVMQAYSQIVDPDLTIGQLGGLGSVIEPPTGWTFSTRVLDEELGILSTDRVATVIQDELANTYQRIDT